MIAQAKVGYMLGGIFLGALLTIVLFNTWALWVESISNDSLFAEDHSIELQGNGYPEYQPKELIDGVFERIWQNPLVVENPDSLNPLAIDDAQFASFEQQSPTYTYTPSEVSGAAVYSNRVVMLYTAHLDRGIDPILASGQQSDWEYRRPALGKFYLLFKHIPILEGRVELQKERYPGADYQGLDYAVYRGKKLANEAVALYNKGLYGEADIAAMRAAAWIDGVDVGDATASYRNSLNFFYNDIKWVKTFIPLQDDSSRQRIVEVEGLYRDGEYELARERFESFEQIDPIFNAVGKARKVSEDNPQIWSALHWLTADLSAFDQVNFDLLSESVSEHDDNLFEGVQVAQHTNQQSCYVTVAQSVYDITDLLLFTELHSGISELAERCGTDVSDYIAGQPVQADSVNTARFKWVLSWFKLGALIDESQ